MNQKEILKSAFEWSSNQVRRLQASIDAGNLEGDELEAAQKTIEDWKAIKADFESTFDVETKKFSADWTEDQVKMFAIGRQIYNDVRSKHKESEFEELISEVIPDDKVKMMLIKRYITKSEPELTKPLLVKAIACDIKDIDTSDKDALLKLFSAKPAKEYLKSAVNFLEEILKRIKGAEEVDQEKVELYENSIRVLTVYISGIKKFSAEESVTDILAKVNNLTDTPTMFSHTLSNPEFLKEFQAMLMNYEVKFIKEDGPVDTFEVKKNGNSAQLEVKYEDEDLEVLINGEAVLLDELNITLEAILGKGKEVEVEYQID